MQFMKHLPYFPFSPSAYILLSVIALFTIIPILGHPRYSENDYIGILSDIKVGFRFIPAGSVVTEDVPQYCLVGGVPAKIIRRISIDS